MTPFNERTPFHSRDIWVQGCSGSQAASLCASSLRTWQEWGPGLWQVAPTRAPYHLHCEEPGRCRESEHTTHELSEPGAALEWNGSHRQ